MTQPVIGEFTATGASEWFKPTMRTMAWAHLNISASGTFVATVKIERSFDGGTTSFVCSSDSAGTEASFTAPFSVVAEEPSSGVLYRLNCTAYTSGTVTYRISQ